VGGGVLHRDRKVLAPPKQPKNAKRSTKNEDQRRDHAQLLNLYFTPKGGGGENHTRYGHACVTREKRNRGNVGLGAACGEQEGTPTTADSAVVKRPPLTNQRGRRRKESKKMLMEAETTECI